MKILHILDHSLPLHSGYAFRSQNIFREQRKRGWQPVIVTSPKHEESWKGPWQKEEQIEGFHYYRTGPVSHNGLPFEAEIRLMAALGRQVMEVAKLEKPDILHAHSPVLNVVPALWVGRKLKIPVVYEIRAFWEDAGVDHGTYTEDAIKYRLVRAVESWVCRHADHVTVLCDGLKQELTKRGIPANKISVVYNGVSPDDFAHSQPDAELAKAWNLDGKKVIGFIGSFYRYEGIDLLVDAFARLSSSHADLVLLLVGGGEMEKELKEQIKRLNLPVDFQINNFKMMCNLNPQSLAQSAPGRAAIPARHRSRQAGHLPASARPWQAGREAQPRRTGSGEAGGRNPQYHNRVIMPGRIPHDRIPRVYALIDILAYPRYSMRLTELVTPLKPLEAMAMGKALVASDVGGHQELIWHGETGLLFPAGDSKALAASLQELIKDDALRHRLECHGPTWVRKHHTWEKTTSVYEDIYAKALAL